MSSLGTSKSTSLNAELLLFNESMPLDDLNASSGFRSECPPDKKVKVDDLFRFKRRVGDYSASIVALLLALFFLVFFFTQTGWQSRKLPDELTSYLAHQVGWLELEGRVTRFGQILKQSWVIPMLCLLLLVPAAAWNCWNARTVHRWRQRFLLPTNARYEWSRYVAALEYAAYFIVYTMAVPILGYLLSTMIFGTFLTYRLGYRSLKWISISMATSFVIVLIFRSGLQIKTPLNIWAYDQLPTTLRAFMLTYF
jgi:hypothetical protein